MVLVGGGGVAALSAFGGDNSPGQKVGSGPSDDKSSDANVLADDKALLDAATAKPLAATGAWAVAKTSDGSTAPEKAFVCQSQRFAGPSSHVTSRSNVGGFAGTPGLPRGSSA